MSQTFSLGDKNSWIAKIQRALNEIIYSALTTDGEFGQQTKNALQDWQLYFQLSPTGVYDGKTQEILDAYINERFLVDSDYTNAATSIRVSVPMVKAVTEVEARGEGFLLSGRPIILFERHIFYKQLNQRIDAGDDAYVAALIKALNQPVVATSSAKTWLKGYLLSHCDNIYNPNVGGYQGTVKGVEYEYKRLEQAKILDLDAALSSASYGLFQIMGFNYKTSGFQSASDMYLQCARSERNQLKAFCSFVQANPRLINALRAEKMTDFAVAYNGPAQAGYDKRLQTALDKFKSQP